MPATSNYVLSKGRRAAAAVTKKRFVKLTGTNDAVTPCTVAGEAAYGVALFSVSAAEIVKNKEVSVQVEGRAVVEASAALAVGVPITTDTSGRAAAAATGNWVLGIVDEPAAGVGNECSVLLTPGGGKF